MHDAGLPGEPENPENLPVREVYRTEIPLLNPLDLLREIYKSRLPVGSQLVGAFLYRDAEGRAKLALLHSV